MQENFQTTKAAGAGANAGLGNPPNAVWSNPGDITADDASSASMAFSEGGQNSDTLVASAFGFDLPDFATIDGIAVRVDGSQTSSSGDISISPTSTTTKDASTLNQTYGGAADLWSADEIDVVSINTGFQVNIDMNDVSGGDGVASVEYVEVTIYWHVDLNVAPADVPTRVDYKVYSREGNYLGMLPVTNPFAFSQDMNSAGSTLQLTCSKGLDNGITTEPLETEDEQPIETEDDETIEATLNSAIIALGADSQEALYKNSNRIKVWMYNYWYPNGKLMFSGQVNRVGFQYGGQNATVTLSVLSDGLDLVNYIVSGGVDYIADQSQTSQDANINGPVIIGGFTMAYWGTTITIGAGVTQMAALKFKLASVDGSPQSPSARIWNSVADAVAGAPPLATASVSFNSTTPTDYMFIFDDPIAVTPGGSYYIALDILPNVYQYIYGANVYGGGETIAVGSGTSFTFVDNDTYFTTYRSVPSTIRTFTDEDPITGMAHDALAEYNTQGGYVHERNFVAAGYTLNYAFNLANVFDAHKKFIEMSPTGYHSYIDLGTAEMDIGPMSSDADFTVVLGRDVVVLNLALTIEQIKNYLLFIGGEVSGANLFRQYQDITSAEYYGRRMATKTDNRVIDTPTADAIGDAFTAENKDEAQETSITVPVTAMDHTLLTPGKTIGFRNAGNFIDEMVLPIVRREFNVNFVVLTLGRLPVRMNDEVQRLNRELLDEQTINNPASPT